MPEEEFKDKIAQLADQPGVTDAVIQPAKRKPGRQPGFSPKKTIEAAPVQIEKPVPPVNDFEADMFAQVFCGIANMMVKKEYRDKLNFTKEEFLNITRPAVQLKAYYMPNMGGIYAVWMQLALAGGALGITKYKTISEIMENEQPRKKDHPNSGDQGYRQIDESKGTSGFTPPSIDI